MAYKVSNDIDIDRQEYRIQVSLYHCYSMEYKYRKKDYKTSSKVCVLQIWGKLQSTST